jgi:hypothetical protein
MWERVKYDNQITFINHGMMEWWRLMTKERYKLWRDCGLILGKKLEECSTLYLG